MLHEAVVLLLASLGAAIELVSPARPYCRENSTCDFKHYDPIDRKFFYKVQGVMITVQYQSTISMCLSCVSPGTSMDNSNLPVMEQLQEVEKVIIIGCSPPLNTSYADLLEKMHFKVTKSLLLMDLPTTPILDYQHLADLPINTLKIQIYLGQPQRPTQYYLDGLEGLRTLELFNVIPEPEALMRLPKALEYLVLEHVQLPNAERKLSNGSAWLERLSSLRNLTIVGLHETGILTVPAFKSLPYLTKLSLSYIRLESSSLVGKFNGSSIKDLVMRSCELNDLPEKLFEGANLTTLDLSLNNLIVKEGVFSSLKWLTKLDLEGSQMNSTKLVYIVSALPRLKILKASNNNLASLCGDADISSKLTWPKSLSHLDLSKSNLTRFCPGWINNDVLMEINLRGNDIRYLNYNDLIMKRAVLKPTVTIDLANNPNLRIAMSRGDIKQCSNKSATSFDANNGTRAKVMLKLSNLLTCDYNTFLHEVLSNCPWLQLDKAVFRKFLSRLKSEEILCPYNGSDCLPGCLCYKRPRDNATVVRCAGPLSRLPPWPSAMYENPLVLHVDSGTLIHIPHLKLVELYASNKSISNLSQKDIPDTLLVMDISFNNLSYISKAVAGKLAAIGKYRSVYLKGNRLICNCSVLPALELLKHVVRDFNETLCTDGTDVLHKLQILNELCAFPVLRMLLVLISIVLILIVAVLMLHRFKPQVRQVLFKLNWGRRFVLRVNDNDAEKTFDVFLSYAHSDLEVLTKLRNRLEGSGYSTFEHNRDWQPGVPIINQIESSVKYARRTLLLVSDNYADSKWAVKEFQCAHAHAMERQTTRVLVVKYNLCQPERLPPDLQLYLKYNTYLDFHDAHFWEKLTKAMPMRFQISN